MEQPKPARRPRVDHFVWWDTPGKRLRRAICGALVRVGEEAGSIGPSCPDCQRLLESVGVDLANDLASDDRQQRNDALIDAAAPLWPGPKK
jgi:hypothetical protein